MVDMIRQGGGKNDNVIEVNKDKAIKEVSEDIIHQSLENGWSVGQPE